MAGRDQVRHHRVVEHVHEPNDIFFARFPAYLFNSRQQRAVEVAPGRRRQLETGLNDLFQEVRPFRRVAVLDCGVSKDAVEDQQIHHVGQSPHRFHQAEDRERLVRR